VFELGSSLREARVRREIPLAQVAEETRIRRRYLEALEEERFELLPGPVYAKGFLRAYADYLSLDSQLFVDEYNVRFVDDEPLPAPVQLGLRARPRRREVLAAVVLVTAVAGALIAWQQSGSSGPARSRTTSAASGASAAAHASRPVTHRSYHTTTPTLAPLVLRATGGPCWLSVRRGSKNGRLLFEGTLQQGQWRRLPGRRLWIRIGAPWNLEASRAQRRLSLPHELATVTVTAAGVRPVSQG
jgi:cytoskeleton protein RodZ